MTEQLRPTPEQGPEIIRLADVGSGKGLNLNERVMRFHFTDAEDEERRREIAKTVFDLLYAGDFGDKVLDLSDSGIGYLAFGKNITAEKPDKPEEDRTEGEQEAFRLMRKYLVRSEFTPRRTIQTF